MVIRAKNKMCLFSKYIFHAFHKQLIFSAFNQEECVLAGKTLSMLIVASRSKVTSILKVMIINAPSRTVIQDVL